MDDPLKPCRRLKAQTIQACLDELTAHFEAAGIETPGLDARKLLSHATGFTREQLITSSEVSLSEQQANEIEVCLRRRLNREPVSRIIGKRAFYGHDFKVTPATLDPRPETELLVECALAFATARGLKDAPLRILDIGTGTGAVLISLLSELPNARGVGSDISAAAVAVAAANAQTLGVAGRTRFVVADGTTSLDDEFDILVSNPPYIPTAHVSQLSPDVKDFDPHQALDGGPDGLLFYRRFALDACRLVPNGLIAFEVGAGQAEHVENILRAAMPPQKRPKISRKSDLAGHQRCVAVLTHS